MKAIIQRLGKSGATAVTQHDIAVTLAPDCYKDLKIGDTLQINLHNIGEEQVVKNMTNKTEFKITLHEHDVHDLQLPSNHGSSRIPSITRRKRA